MPQLGFNSLLGISRWPDFQYCRASNGNPGPTRTAGFLTLIHFTSAFCGFKLFYPELLSRSFFLVTACNAWTNGRSWASECLCTGKSETDDVQLLPCMQNKHENKAHFLKCLLLTVIIWTRVITKFSDAIIGSYGLHCTLNSHSSFHMNFLVSVN